MDDTSEAVRDILNLYPLRYQYMNLLEIPGANKALLRKAQEAIRLKLITTIDYPLAEVCEKFPAAPSLAIKLAILRRYIRTHGLHLKRGHSHRPFWGKVDGFYADKVQSLGDHFDAPGWRTFLEETMEEDFAIAPPQTEAPLFTYKPIMMNLSYILN